MAVLHCPQSCVSSASDLCSAWPCIALTLYLYSLNPVLAQPLTCADLHSLLLLVTCLSLLFSPFSLVSSCSTFLPHHLVALIISSMLHILAYVLPCATSTPNLRFNRPQLTEEMMHSDSTCCSIFCNMVFLDSELCP